MPFGATAGGIEDLNPGKLQDFEGNFGIWVGTIIPVNAMIYMVTEKGREKEAVVRMGTIKEIHLKELREIKSCNNYNERKSMKNRSLMSTFFYYIFQCHAFLARLIFVFFRFQRKFL